MTWSSGPQVHNKTKRKLNFNEKFRKSIISEYEIGYRYLAISQTCNVASNTHIMWLMILYFIHYCLVMKF